ncbi:MFS transporter [Acidobacteriota bacterium]
MQEESLEKVLKLRWIVLVMMGLVVFGVYYAYDSVVPIADYIISELGATRAQYGLLFSYYSLPNLLMVLLGGILLDRVGIRKAGMFFVTLAVVGVLITALGGSKSFQMMLWGRLLYGIGAESLCVTQIKVLSKWFRGKEFAFAMGLYITLVRLGNFASLNLGTPLQTWSGNWRLALWVALGAVVLSFIVNALYSMLDKAKEEAFRERGPEVNTDKFVFREAFKFKRSYWFVNLLCVTFYSAVLPFVAFSKIFLENKYELSAGQASFYGSLLFVATMVFTPLFGIVVDKVGKRATIMIIGAVIIVPVYLALGLTNIHPAPLIIGIGIAFSLVPSALWSAVPIMVEQNRLGTAFGLITIIQNFGLTVVPWLAGKLTDSAGGDYTNAMLMFAFLGLIGLVFSVALVLSEKKGPKTGIQLPTKAAHEQFES